MWLAVDTTCPPDGPAQVELKLDLGISSAFGLLDFWRGQDVCPTTPTLLCRLSNLLRAEITENTLLVALK